MTDLSANPSTAADAHLLADRLALLDYRRRVAEIYRPLRTDWRPERAEALHAEFWRARERLFRRHPQSPVAAARRSGVRLRYHPYRQAYRQLVRPEPHPEPTITELRLAADGMVRLMRFARVTVQIEDTPVSLALYWVGGYGGGLFLPFRDATNGKSSYGGGRYLLDTIKEADLGSEGGPGGDPQGERLILDFNFAYHPSCAYNPVWDCPLAPPENRLELPVEAGEMLPDLPDVPAPEADPATQTAASRPK